MKTIILIRHGETDTNKAGLLHTNIDECALNNLGVKQIRKTAKYLIKYKPEIIFTSDLNRSILSTKIISKINHCPYKTIKGLEERNWGKWSGKTWSEISDVVTKMSLHERYSFIPPSGESWKHFEIRLIKTIKEILNSVENVIVIVTHGGVIRALMPYFLDVQKEESFKYDPDNASITIFEYDKMGFKQIIYNYTKHLK